MSRSILLVRSRDLGLDTFRSPHDTTLVPMKDILTHRAEAEINNLTTRQPGEILLLLAQIGAQGVGGYQVDVSAVTDTLDRVECFLTRSTASSRCSC